MAYTTDAPRCDAVTKHGMRCVLGDRHAWHHVTAEGGHFADAGSSYAFPWDATAPGDIRKGGQTTAGQKVTADNASEYVASVLSDRISAVAQRVEAETPQREALTSRVDQLSEQLASEKAAREALSAEFVTTRSGRLSPLEDRVAKLELPYGHVQAVKDTHNALVERIERIERDLRDTHELAERVAEVERHLNCMGRTLSRSQQLERKPEQWDADYAEPPRDQVYAASDGYLWRFEDYKGWRFRAQYEDTWTSGANDGEGGWIWAQLVDGRAADAGVGPQFPWKVWTNG